MKLTWGIRQSFESYVRHAQGDITVVPPAELVDETFVFPGCQSEETFEFTGGVRFTAYGGMLSVHIVNPQIEMSGTDGVLRVSDKEGKGRIEIARLADVDRRTGLRADLRLTILGARLFGDVYRPGDALDPIVVTAPVPHA